MDIPKPPDDLELKNIIDKLANFVARNGPEFENMTKQKQKDNLKFSFLYGGEYYNYYQYKVNSERAVSTGLPPGPQSQQWQSAPPPTQPTITTMLQVAPPSVASAVPQLAQVAPPQLTQPPPAPTVAALTSLPPTQVPLLTTAASQLQEQLQQQRKAAQDQITQSEQNLAAQYTVLIQQQQIQIDEAISNSQEDKLRELSEECDISLDELHKVVRPIIDSCTKDAISNGKNWIFQHCTSPQHGEVIAKYLAKRITAKDATFETKLHLIYLINDVLHHCMRKNAEDLKSELQKVVVPAFCSAHLSVTEDKQQKLVKLLNLWEQNHYFDLSVIEQMRDPSTSMSNYQANLITDHAPLVTEITHDMNQHYSSLQKQHQDFVTHLTSQLAMLDQQIQQQLIVPAVATSDPSVVIPSAAVGVETQAACPQTAPALPTASSESQPPLGTAPVDPSVPPRGMPPQPSGPIPSFPPPGFSQPPPNFSAPPPGFGAAPQLPRQFDYAHGQASPIVQDYNHGQTGPSFQLPDLSKPPPGFPMIPPTASQQPPASRPPPIPLINEADLTPTVPYFELPAGLMAPLVKLEDSEYKPLVPEDIRLPPPMPPSERLLAAVEAFYSAPSHERPRDSDGWEKLGLYEFFRAKQRAKRAKEDQRREAGRSSRSRSRSRSRSGSRSPPRRPRRRRWLSCERKERSRSPPSDTDLPYQRSSRSRSKSRPRSQSRSRSRSPSRSRSRSPSPAPRRRSLSRERSVTPPTFQSQETFQSNQPPEARLGSENRGHQLLMKMGWGGKGLGSSEQGRMDPVETAEVRDKADMYRGIGIAVNDPFEQFRKSKAKGFVQRMRAKEDA